MRKVLGLPEGHIAPERMEAARRDMTRAYDRARYRKTHPVAVGPKAFLVERDARRDKFTCGTGCNYGVSCTHPFDLQFVELEGWGGRRRVTPLHLVHGRVMRFAGHSHPCL